VLYGKQQLTRAEAIRLHAALGANPVSLAARALRDRLALLIDPS
jgi:hypothetical protein